MRPALEPGVEKWFPKILERIQKVLTAVLVRGSGATRQDTAAPPDCPIPSSAQLKRNDKE